MSMKKPLLCVLTLVSRLNTQASLNSIVSFSKRMSNLLLIARLPPGFEGPLALVHHRLGDLFLRNDLRVLIRLDQVGVAPLLGPAVRLVV